MTNRSRSTMRPEKSITGSDRPILFSGPMVRAILEGRKTQTRRVIADSNSQGNYRASELLLDAPRVFVDDGPSPAGNPGQYLHAPVNARLIEERRGWGPGNCDESIIERLYPRWFPGDRLWVRETWIPRLAGEAAIYRADLEPAEAAGIVALYSDKGWHPSIFMPRRHSRITLGITRVRAERLQDISARDAVAEGIDPKPHLCDCEAYARTWKYCPATSSSIVMVYAAYWDSLHAKGDGISFESNPWVWVLEFDRIEPKPVMSNASESRSEVHP